MNKDKLKRLEKKYKELGKEIEALKASDEEEYIECHMEFSKSSGTSSMGLKFGSNQGLFYNEEDRIYGVASFHKNMKIKTKIRVKPTPQDELEVGKWYVVRDFEELSDVVEDKERYKLYLGKGEYCFVDWDEDIIVRGTLWNNWHEVVEVKE